MTYDEIVDAALGRASAWGAGYPGTNKPLYRRISVRQKHLFAHAAGLDQDFYGTDVTGTLSDNRLDLRDLDDQVPAIDMAEAITRIEIAGAGTSDYAAGDEVHVIKIRDPDSALPPRVTLRSQVIEGYGDDLDGVNSMKVFYSRLPVTRNAGDCVVELAEPHSELLVVDLTRWIATKAMDVEGEVRSTMVSSLNREENELMAEFDRYVSTYAGLAKARFDGARASAERS